MLRMWLIRLLPFMQRWIHAAPACCGMCPTCIGAAATGMTLDVLATNPLRRGGRCSCGGDDCGDCRLA